jgi:hypothetical protein
MQPAPSNVCQPPWSQLTRGKEGGNGRKERTKESLVQISCYTSTGHHTILTEFPDSSLAELDCLFHPVSTRKCGHTLGTHAKEE